MSRELREDIAFVLHRHAWKETSFILRVLTRSHGRISVVARSLRGSRTQSPVLSGQPAQLQWKSGRELGSLISMSPLPPQRPMPTGDNWWASQYLTELVLHATREADPVPAIFDAYLGSLDRLRDTDCDAAIESRLFESVLVQELGVGFDLRHDSTGAGLLPEGRYQLIPEQGLVACARGGVAASDWLALAQKTLDAAAARRLRRSLQEQLGLLVDFSKLRARSQWQAARALREDHQQHAARDQ